jgi:hypothetical protein
MSTTDLAVLCKSNFFPVSPICDNHTVYLEPINIPQSDFQYTFFLNNRFYINPNADPNFIKFDGKIDTTGFQLGLFELILDYACQDLNVSPLVISIITIIELRNELYNITLSSLDIVSSTKYDIIDIIPGNTFVISSVFINKNPTVKPVIIKFTFVIT